MMVTYVWWIADQEVETPIVRCRRRRGGKVLEPQTQRRPPPQAAARLSIVAVDLEASGDIDLCLRPFPQQRGIERASADRRIQEAHRGGSEQLMRVLQHLARQRSR